MVYLLSLVGNFGKDVKDTLEVLKTVMVLSRSQAQVVKEVLLVIQSHAYVELLEDLREELCRNEVVPPVTNLAFALKAKTIESLRLNLVSL